MKDITKYQGIIPAFYACYDKDGQVSAPAVRALAKYLLDKGVKGLYVGGSSGECIYQSVAERKQTLESVMEVVRGKLTVIAHVACNNTADSRELAAHAESLGVDAIAAIPPIYFHLPPSAIAKYWNDISDAAPNTDFIIYNIPQLAGVALTTPLLQEMLKNPRVVGVKNSSMPVQDIQMWRDEGAVVFNGPDEQLLSGLAAGAAGGPMPPCRSCTWRSSSASNPASWRRAGRFRTSAAASSTRCAPPRATCTRSSRRLSASRAVRTWAACAHPC